jgi:hypothetical protein
MPCLFPKMYKVELRGCVQRPQELDEREQGR